MPALSNPAIRNPANPSTTWYMARKTAAYVDTSALIAFLDRSDSYHPLFRRLFSDTPELKTSALVIAEGHGWFLRLYNAFWDIQFLIFVYMLDMLTFMAFDSVALVN